MTIIVTAYFIANEGDESFNATMYCSFKLFSLASGIHHYIYVRVNKYILSRSTSCSLGGMTRYHTARSGHDKFDMINAAYDDKPLIFIGAIRLSLSRLFLTLC